MLPPDFVTQFPVRFLLQCQTCGHRHESVWPVLPDCPVCTLRTAGDGIDYDAPIRVDAYGNGTYRARPGRTQTILSGRMTDAMVFEQAAAVRAWESRSGGASSPHQESAS